MNDAMLGEENDVSVCQPASSSSGKKSKSKRKRSIDSTGEKLVELMEAFCEQTKSGMSDLTKKMGVEYDLQTQRKDVYEHFYLNLRGWYASNLINNSICLAISTKYNLALRTLNCLDLICIAML